MQYGHGISAKTGDGAHGTHGARTLRRDSTQGRRHTGETANRGDDMQGKWHAGEKEIREKSAREDADEHRALAKSAREDADEHGGDLCRPPRAPAGTQP